MSVVTNNILSSSLVNKFTVIHLDTADRRNISNIGKLDFWNVLLSIKNFFEFLKILLLSRLEIIYVPISQNILGFLRD
ncbi:MAG: hypothetical protein ACTSVV_14885, partial [Promethearchaeota archaeon]